MRRSGRWGLGWLVRVLAGVALTAVFGVSPAGAQFAVNVQDVRAALFSGLGSGVGSLPTPGGGAFTFELDPALGVFTRSTESLGPIFADRAETTGRGRVTLSASYTRHSFDELDGVKLRTGELFGLLVGFFPDRIRLNLLQLREEARAEVFALGALYGVTDRLDVGVTVPILRVKLRERIRRPLFVDCVPNFDPATLAGCTRPSFPNDEFLPTEAESTGLGDLVLRTKYNVWRSARMMGGRVGLAAGLDVKLPTGDTGDRKGREARIVLGPTATPADSRFTLGDPPLGTGIVRVKPNLIASGSWFGVSPHINVGAELGKTAGITNDLLYAVGVEYAPAGWITLVADLLGRHAFDVDRPRFNRLGPIPGSRANPDTLAASLGIKVNPVGTLLVFVNVILPLNENSGIRDDVTPTAGLEWSF